MSTNGARTPVVDAATIQLERIRQHSIPIPIVGTTPLIVNRWAEKAKAEMLAKHMSARATTKAPKAPKDPVANFNATRYIIDADRDGLPSVAFKSAMVSAGRMFDGVTMVQLRTMLFVDGVVAEDGQMLVPIDGTPVMREDMVRVGGKLPDIRHRASYWPWSATLIVRFLPDQMSHDSVVALADAAGFGGVGEWRPERSATGIYGTFRVAEEAL